MKKHVKINIVPSFHYDVAYLKTYDEYLKMCCHNIKQALYILQNHDDYHFTLEQVILIREFWNRYPGERELLKKHVQSGRLCVAPGMFVVPDMNMCDGESLYRQFRAGKEWLKEHLNYEPEACLIADCWGHHAQLPQILRQSGYDYYIFWRCMRRDVMKSNFIWEGLDRSRIKTQWLARGYSGISFPSAADKINHLDLDFAGVSRESVLSLTKTLQQYGNDEDVLIFNGGDFAFPQESAAEYVRSYNEIDDEYHFAFSTIKQHLDSVDFDKTEVVTGEFNTSQQGTFTTNIRIKQKIKEVVNLILSIERLAVILGRKTRDDISLWELPMKQQFHDIICGSICDGAVDDACTELQSALRIAYEEKAAVEGLGTELRWFNPLEWERKEIVREGEEDYLVRLKPFGFTPPEEGIKLIPQIKETYADSFKNEWYRAKIDKEGYISSLVENESNVNIIFDDTPCPFGSLGLQIDNGDVWLNFEGPISGGSVESSLTQNKRDPYNRGNDVDIVARKTFLPKITEARVVSQTLHTLEIEQQGILDFWKINIPFTTTIRFSSFTPRIEYTTRFTPMGKNFRIRAAFPTGIKRGAIRHEIPFGIQERAEAEFAAMNWIDYGEPSHGLALLNRGIPANNVDDGIMLLTLFRSIAMEYKTESVLSYNEGEPHEFHYAVMPHGSDSDSDIIREGKNFNFPSVLTSILEEKKLPQGSFVPNKKNVFVSGLRSRGDEIFLRVYEGTGVKTSCSLSLPPGGLMVADADGLEREKGPYREADAPLEIDFKPFEIKNFLFRRTK